MSDSSTNSLSLTALTSATALTLALSACGTGEEDETAEPDNGTVQSPQETDETETADDDAPSADPAELPDTPAGQTAEYVLEVINAEEDSTAQDWQDRLSESFRAELDEASVAEFINEQLRPAAPWTATGHQGTETLSSTRIEGAGGALDLQLEVDAEEQLTQLVFLPAQEPPEPAESFDEIEQRLPELPGEAQLLVLEGDEEVLRVGDGEPAAMGSVFKLWVLAAVVETVEAGYTSWDETLVLEDQHLVPSSLELADARAGDELTVQQAAQAMIEVSDNTATDLLMDLVGRDAVEQAVTDSGHHDPDLLSPFLTTRELFYLRWADPELSEEYASAGEQQRRDLLDEIPGGKLEITETDLIPDDGAEHGLEWFGTGEDIAAVHELLEVQAAEHPQLRDILGTNSGVLPQNQWWDQIAFKGGSSPGVLAGSWRAEGAEGTARIVVLQTMGQAEEVALNEAEYWVLAQAALEMEG
ncbi:serine hydrolase [Nesterenkonia ebinurensis]|uniref:serine hydrolase n=1 Tax=Nesterenkonia ebinurensis TaxID=2608252 RepID=UPI00123E3B09|nr:serine hydrolase [Nesterenkonia ebinurensis]